MYVLVMIIIALHTGEVETTHFKVPTAKICGDEAKLLSEKSTPDIKIEALCAPLS